MSTARKIYDEAARFHIELHKTPSAQRRMALNTWLAADKRHRSAYKDICATWDALEGIDPVVLKDTGPSDAHRPWFASAASRALAGMRAIDLGRAVAASFVVAVACAVLFVWRPFDPPVRKALEPNHRATRFGEIRTVYLGDGTRVTLDSDTEIAVSYSRGRRAVALLNGAALFKVVHDGARPFDVTAGTVTARAIGTEFSVRRDGPTQATVLVKQGVVGLGSAPDSSGPGAAPFKVQRELTARDLGTMRDGKIEVFTLAVEDVGRQLAWTEGRLTFEETRIADVLAQFRRYDSRVVVVDDPEINEIRVGGSFSPYDVTDFIKATPIITGNKVCPGTEGNVIHLRACAWRKL